MYIIKCKLFSNIDNGLISFSIKNNEKYSINDNFIDCIKFDNEYNLLIFLKNGVDYNKELVKEHINSFVADVCYNLSTKIYGLNKIVLYEIDDVENTDNKNNTVVVHDKVKFLESSHIEKRIPRINFYQDVIAQQNELIREIYKIFNVNNFFALQYEMIYDYIKNKIEEAIKNNTYQENTRIVSNNNISSNKVTIFVAQEHGINELISNKYNKLEDGYTNKRNSIAHNNCNNLSDYVAQNNNVSNNDILDLLKFADEVFTKI